MAIPSRHPFLSYDELREVLREAQPHMRREASGHERFWAETEPHVGKIFHVKAGESLSVRVHRQKNETLHLLSGEIRLKGGASPEEMILVPLALGESFRLAPGTVHTLHAATDSDILEATTPHLNGLVSFSGRYGRAAGAAGTE